MVAASKAASDEPLGPEGSPLELGERPDRLACLFDPAEAGEATDAEEQ